MKRLAPSLKQIVQSVLLIEQNRFANKIGLIDTRNNSIDYRTLIDSVGAIDSLSRQGDEYSKRVALLLIALCWELSDCNYHDSLREIFVVALSRMGVAPSAIMIDDIYKESNVYAPFTSYINSLSVCINQMEYEVRINNIEYLFTSFQKKVWDSIDINKIVCISAPTSAGKSFVICLKITQMVLSGAGTFLYIVPTISLVSQVIKDLSKLFIAHKIDNVEIFGNYHKKTSKSVVYVLTQERAISAFNTDEAFKELDMLVVDEIQNIERVANEDDQRSKILYDVLKEIKHKVAPKKIILSGPRLQNLGDLGFDLFDEVSQTEETKLPPVISLTYSINQKSKKDGEYYLSQYCDIFSYSNKIKITNYKLICGIGGAIYNDDFHEYLFSVVSRLSKGQNNIIFSPNPSQARKTALYLSYKLEKNNTDPSLYDLSRYIKEYIHPEYDLAKTVEVGIAYHTGKLPMHARSAIEDAFSAGIIKNIVCTTTLMQGVNFPASNIILRNPNLFVKRSSIHESAQLSSYEFSNLRGRAGRMLKDFIGRTIVLDQSSFEQDDSQGTLFMDAEKELSAGYGDYYEKYKEEIYSHLYSDNVVIDGPEKKILTHIRQMIYRYRYAGIKRLQEVGIDIDQKYYSAINKSLNSLTAPKDVILKNRYWDPIDIEYLFINIKNGTINILPNNIWAKKVDSDLISAIKSMAKILPYYYKRYIDRELSINDKYVWSISSYATRWGREELLRDILKSRKYGDNPSEEIEKAVSLITNKVAYGLPMLLKPLSDLSHKDNSLLSCIELGAYSKITKYLISKGVPRDTSIFLKNQFSYKYINDDDFDEIKIKEWIGEIKTSKNICAWMRLQIEHIL